MSMIPRVYVTYVFSLEQGGLWRGRLRDFPSSTKKDPFPLQEGAPDMYFVVKRTPSSNPLPPSSLVSWNFNISVFFPSTSPTQDAPILWSAPEPPPASQMNYSSFTPLFSVVCVDLSFSPSLSPCSLFFGFTGTLRT